MAAFLLVDFHPSLSNSPTHPDQGAHGCRPEHARLYQLSPSLTGIKHLDSSGSCLFSPREVKFHGDHVSKHPNDAPKQHSPTLTRCTLSPLSNGLEPLIRKASGRPQAAAVSLLLPSEISGAQPTSSAGDMDGRSALFDHDGPGQRRLQTENPQQPSPSRDGDVPHSTSYTDRGQELDSRRSYRASPSYVSVSQSSNSSRRQSMRSGAVQLVGTPSKLERNIKGVTGVYMTLAAIILGITAVLQKGGLFGLANDPTNICRRCDGYGIERCNICRGRGVVEWEGKLRRADPCPLCFGSCTKKCSSCGGVRVHKGTAPFMQQASERSARRKN